MADTHMAEAPVNIQIDGQPIKARKGEMIMQAADREGVYIPDRKSTRLNSSH